jgi:hypothetical protein
MNMSSRKQGSLCAASKESYIFYPSLRFHKVVFLFGERLMGRVFNGKMRPQTRTVKSRIT